MPYFFYIATVLILIGVAAQIWKMVEQKEPKDSPIKIIAILFLTLGFVYMMHFYKPTPTALGIDRKKVQVLMHTHFNNLKGLGKLPPSFEATFDISTHLDTINIAYGYTINEIDAQPIEGYMYHQSTAEFLWLSSLDKMLAPLLTHNLDSGIHIEIHLFGYATDMPASASYQGEFGSFPDKGKPMFYILNGTQKVLIELAPASGIDNAEMAFLRAYSMGEYIDKYVATLRDADIKYTYHAITRKSNNRRVELEIKAPYAHRKG